MSFDYYGNDLRTRQDWECEEMMSDILDRYFNDTPDKRMATSSKQTQTVESYPPIPPQDMDTLREHAANLFNTAKMSDEELRRAMRALAEMISLYRFGGFKVKKARQKGERLAKKSQEEREKQIVEHAKAIFEITGVPLDGFLGYAGEHYPLFQELKKIIDNPSSLFPERWTPHGSWTITDIKNLLHSMKLPKKTKAIKNFIDALRKNPAPSEY